MINYNTGTIIVDTELNLVDVTEGYSKYVRKGHENSFLENIKTEDQHLVYEMVEKLTDQDKTDICFRLCERMEIITGLQLSVST